MWRLNASLLTDPTLLPDLHSALIEFFKHNATPGSDPLMVWEAHKCTIRGELISVGARKKRARDGEVLRLVRQIRHLEAQHKQSLSIQSATSLLESRKALRQILDTRTKRFLFFRRKLYYEHGDKPGNLLARAFVT